VRTHLALALAAAVLGAGASGCASTGGGGAGGVRTRRPLAHPINGRVVAVYPFSFRWEEPPWRQHLLSMDAVDALSRRNRVVLFGPGEFRVLRPDADDPRLGTDLMRTLADRGQPVTGFVALRAWAERRVAQTSTTVRGGGAAAAVETRYVEHLELLDGQGDGVLLELEGEALGEPGAAVDPSDPTPELTRLHRRLVAAAWEALLPRLGDRPLPGLPVETRWLPAAALAWSPAVSAGPGSTADPLEADLARLGAYRFVDPGADDATLAKRLRLPGGLLVERAEGPFAALRAGDVITAVNGEPAAGRHVLQRAVALSRTGALDLSVVRDGARRSVTVVAR